MTFQSESKSVIDAHQHFWRYDPEEYPWLDSSRAQLRRNFLPEDLRIEIESAGVEGVVSVQARQSIRETRWLLDFANEHRFICGVVGWLPLSDPTIGEKLAGFADEPKFKGVRHVVQDENAADFLDRSDFNAGVARLHDHDLTYDLLILENQLEATIRFVDRHPCQVFVLDHLAKPKIRAGALEPWRQRLLELGRREHVFCKLSGMVTEADWQSWSEPDLAPYLECALEAFGPERLMIGSDWPICLLACKYSLWIDLLRRYVAKLTPTEESKILAGNAVRTYRL